MGFDTYLTVDDEVLLMWRKHADYMPRLLFRHDQAVVADVPNGGDGDEVAYRVQVSYRATVGDVLASLEEAGLGWHASVAAYGEMRVIGQSSGMVMGREYAKGASDEEVQRAVEAFEHSPPERDLEALGRFLAHRWFDPEVDELDIFREITYDGDIESPTTTSFDVYRAASAVDGIDAFHAARAVESWAVLHREAPVLAWPLIMCVFFQFLDRDLEVVYDISEAAFEADVSTVAEGHAYADEYWRGAAGALSAYAASMGRLFSVLASFDNKLGREFWFARASALQARLLELAGSTEDTATKTRGDALEALVEAIVKTEEPELRVVEKNFRTKEEEIDLIVTNGLRDPFWIALGSPLILIECKNWKSKPGVPELRIFESKMKDRGALCRIGIFVSMSGFAETFTERLKAFQANDGIIFALTGDDLATLIGGKKRLTDWLAGPGVMRSMGP